jgi:uncharacterized membrane protein HdeD (DUF308 family)
MLSADPLSVIRMYRMCCVFDRRSLALWELLPSPWCPCDYCNTANARLPGLVRVFVIITGVLNAGVGISSQKTEVPMWLLVTTGVLGMLIGMIALVAPLIIALTITILIAAWALVTGVSDLGLAISTKSASHRALLGLSGIIRVMLK